MLYVYEIEQLFYQSEPDDVDDPVSVFLSVCLSVCLHFLYGGIYDVGRCLPGETYVKTRDILEFK